MNNMKMLICRNKTGDLTLFEDKPKYNETYDIWLSPDLPYYLFQNRLPEVTFENSPMEVELVIKK